ncbi:MAG: hypothetical protein HY731_10205 [Candidatus Tectomicrobia bacterium]|nr:hypothetical protein [Candidatus Tectomicrobia bacterium]
MLRIESMVVGARIADYEVWIKQYGDVLRAQKGFQGWVVANSFGYPTKYTRLANWESRETELAAIWSSYLHAFLKANPSEGLFTMARPGEAYEIVTSVGESIPAGFLLLVEFDLDIRPGNAAAFESGRQKLFELRQKLGNGFILSQMLRFMGNPTKYLISAFYTNRDNAWAAFAMPEYQEVANAYRWSDYAITPPAFEAYEVIHQI